MSPDSFADIVDDAALARYFAGETTDAEALKLRRWVEAEPERGARVERLRVAWTAAGTLRQDWDATRAVARMFAADPAEPRVTGPRFGAWPLTTLRVAAAAVFVAGAAALWRSSLSHGRSTSATQSAFADAATRRGERASLRLPDGTQVMLGPDSRLRYVVAERGPRVTRLDGEGYFVVTHDAARPFTVQTAHGVVTDIGTRFSVRSDPRDSVVVVAVAEGMVSLRAAAGTENVVLGQGDVGLARIGRHVEAERGIDLDRYLGWTTGRLIFRDTPLRDVQRELSRWYGIDVQLGDPSLAAKRVTATFKAEPPAQVVRLIAASLGLRIEERGSLVIFRGDRS